MAKKLAIIIFCFAFLFITGVVHGETPFEKGMKEFKEENYEEALEFFLEARKLDPTSSIVAFSLGLTYKHIQNFKEAVPHLRDAVTLIPKIKEALIELIDVLYLTDNLEEAKKWIEVGEKEDILPARLQFLKGLVLAKEGKNKEAISAFEKAKELDKSLAQAAEFYIANAYVKEGKLKQARDRFRFALTIDPTTEMGLYARDYEKFLVEKIEKERPWRLSAGLAYKYDSNVVLRPTSGPVAEMISKAKDNVLNGTFRFGYTVPFSSKSPFNLSFQYSLYTDTYAQTTSYNYISQVITAIPGYNFGKFSVSLPLIYGYDWLDRESYLDLKGLEPTLRFMIGEKTIGEVNFGYYRKDYAKHPINPDEDRDGYNVGGSFGLTYFLKGGEGLLNIKYSPSEERTDGRNWSYNQHRISMGLLYPLPWSFKLQLSGEVAPTNYVHRHTVFDKARKDDIYSGSVGLVYTIIKYIDAIASYSYTREVSNINIYDYTRHIFSIGLEFRY